jgi:neutral ceramidase
MITRRAVLAAAAAGGLGSVVAPASAAMAKAEKLTAPSNAKGSLRVGAAIVDISPPADQKYPELTEFGFEKVNLRAIVLENGGQRAVLIGVATGSIDQTIFTDVIGKVAAEVKAPAANVLISATHVHSATVPGTPGATNAWANQPGYLADAAVRAVRQANARLEPALVGYSTGESYLNVNRDAINPDTQLWTQAANLDGPVDPTVAVLSFVRPGGKPIAAYMTYAMHAINSYLTDYLSGDFPEAMSQWVEQAFGDGMVTVFAQNASGDVNPLWLRTGTNVLASKEGAAVTGYEQTREPIEEPLRDGKVPNNPADPKLARKLFEYEQALGIVLGEEVIRVMSNTAATESDPQIWGAQHTVTCPGRTRLDNAREGVPGVYKDGPDVDILTGVLGIGDTVITTVGAEIYTRIGLGIKGASPMRNTMVATLANGHSTSGYIPDEQSFGHLTFQVLGSKLKPGHAEKAIVDSTTSLISQYASRR